MFITEIINNTIYRCNTIKLLITCLFLNREEYISELKFVPST